ncbi:MAG TPA: hypothetical protein VMA36_13920 [Candidatus Limnocylindria bacterium]|jgi:hypothetical protein|nr:hypothetical protein [Candidatus Limnocylindria bacterium]
MHTDIVRERNERIRQMAAVLYRMESAGTPAQLIRGELSRLSGTVERQFPAAAFTDFHRSWAAPSRIEQNRGVFFTELHGVLQALRRQMADREAVS